jgi:hypothetical protein
VVPSPIVDPAGRHSASLPPRRSTVPTTSAWGSSSSRGDSLRPAWRVRAKAPARSLLASL